MYRLGVAARKPRGPTPAEVREIIDSLVSGRRITRDLTHTAAFRRWFRNSAVVNSDGSPMVVYHGTTATFDAFEPFYRKGEMLGFGVHFAEDVEVAAKYAFEKGVARKGNTPRLIAAFLSVQNPLIADAIESATDIIGSSIVYLGVRYAQKPADENHPYGHGKTEPMAGLAVSILLIFAVIQIAI